MAMAEGTIFDNEEVDVTLTPDGTVDGPVLWEVTTGLSTVNASEDGLTATLVSETLPAGAESADTEYTLTADVDQGEGVRHITETILLHVRRREATTLGIAFSSPRPKGA